MAKVLEPNATIEGKTDLSEELAIFRIALDEELPEGDWFVPTLLLVRYNEHDTNIGAGWSKRS